MLDKLKELPTPYLVGLILLLLPISAIAITIGAATLVITAPLAALIFVLWIKYR